MQVNSASKNGATVVGLPNSVDKIPDVSEVLQTIKKQGLTTDQVLQALWGKEESQSDDLATLQTLRGNCTDKVDARVTRLKVTCELLKNEPAMQGLAARINKVLEKPVQDKHRQISGLVNVYLAAQSKIAKSLDNVFFSFVHLTKLTIKSAVTDKISAMFANNAVGNSDAKETVFLKAVNKEAKALLAFHIRSPKNTEVSAPSPAVKMGITREAKKLHRQFQLLLTRLPEEIRSHPNWPKVEKRMIAYFNHTIEDQGGCISELMMHAMHDFPKFLKSMEVSCKLDGETARKMAFQRELWNIGQDTRPTEEQNKQVTGYAESYANSSVKSAKPGKVPDVLKPGNQLSLAVDTPMSKANGTIVDVTILSFISPALDSEKQPEYALYAQGKVSDMSGMWITTQFKPDTYRKAYETIKNQALSYANSHPDKKEFALTGVGLSAFLSKLRTENEKGSSAEFIEQAQEIGAQVLAELAIDLRKLGKKVVFTDASDVILKKVNTALADSVTDQPEDFDTTLTDAIPLAGRVPGDWINEGMVIFNAWDTHSLLGNKLKNDISLDGFIGSNTLIHPMHALRCAMEAEGIKLA